LSAFELTDLGLEQKKTRHQNKKTQQRNHCAFVAATMTTFDEQKFTGRFDALDDLTVVGARETSPPLGSTEASVPITPKLPDDANANATAQAAPSVSPAVPEGPVASPTTLMPVKKVKIGPIHDNSLLGGLIKMQMKYDKGSPTSRTNFFISKCLQLRVHDTEQMEAQQAKWEKQKKQAEEKKKAEEEKKAQEPEKNAATTTTTTPQTKEAKQSPPLLPPQPLPMPWFDVTIERLTSLHYARFVYLFINVAFNPFLKMGIQQDTGEKTEDGTVAFASSSLSTCTEEEAAQHFYYLHASHPRMTEEFMTPACVPLTKAIADVTKGNPYKALQHNVRLTQVRFNQLILTAKEDARKKLPQGYETLRGNVKQAENNVYLQLHGQTYGASPSERLLQHAHRSLAKALRVANVHVHLLYLWSLDVQRDELEHQRINTIVDGLVAKETRKKPGAPVNDVAVAENKQSVVSTSSDTAVMQPSS
jgi:hypothetical protein